MVAARKKVQSFINRFNDAMWAAERVADDLEQIVLDINNPDFDDDPLLLDPGPRWEKAVTELQAAVASAEAIKAKFDTAAPQVTHTPFINKMDAVRNVVTKIRQFSDGHPEVQPGTAFTESKATAAAQAIRQFLGTNTVVAQMRAHHIPSHKGGAL